MTIFTRSGPGHDLVVDEVKTAREKMKKSIPWYHPYKRSDYLQVFDNYIHAGDDMKKGLADKMLRIPDAQKARSYGGAIRDALEYAGKDLKTQQQIISNIFEDSYLKHLF